MQNRTEKKNKYEKGIRSKLFFTFFRIGLFTFGGGYAMLPLIHNDIVEKRKWISNEVMMDILAISQSAPGAFSINVSTFVGNHLGGFRGALAAVLGSSLPSFIVILFVSYLFEGVRANPFVDAAFMGIRAGVVVLIINAVIKLAAKQKWNVSYAILAVAAFALSVFTDISAIYILAGAGIIGLVYSLFTALRIKGDLPK